MAELLLALERVLMMGGLDRPMAEQTARRLVLVIKEAAALEVEDQPGS